MIINDRRHLCRTTFANEFLKNNEGNFQKLDYSAEYQTKKKFGKLRFANRAVEKCLGLIYEDR